MADSFKRRPVELDSPVRSFIGITPSDTLDIPQRPRALFIGTAGNLTCIGDNGVEVTFNLPTGWHPLSPLRIKATGLTAGGIIGGW
jgi:hypothetical protein